MALDHTQLLLLLVGFPVQNLLILLTKSTNQPPAIWRPDQVAKFPLQLSQRPGLTPINGDEVNLGLLFVGPVRDKGNLAAIRGPAWLLIDLVAVSELPGRAPCRGNDPQIDILFLRLPIYTLQTEDDIPSIRRNLAARDELKLV